MTAPSVGEIAYFHDRAAGLAAGCGGTVRRYREHGEAGKVDRQRIPPGVTFCIGGRIRLLKGRRAAMVASGDGAVAGTSGILRQAGQTVHSYVCRPTDVGLRLYHYWINMSVRTGQAGRCGEVHGDGFP